MKKKFTDLVDFVGGKPVLFEGTKPYVSTGALKSTTISREDIELVEFINRPSRADLEVKKDDILFAKMAFTDKRILIDNDTSNYIYSTGFFAVRAKPNIITTECLYYLLNSKTFKDQKDANSTGATQKAITNSGLKKIYLRIPNYNNQKEIAEILSNIEKIISFKERQLKEYDQLIKSRFVEMFGNPIINEKNHEKAKLKELGLLNRGKSKHRPRNAPELLGGIYPLIQTGDISNSDLYIKEYNSTYSELGLQQSKMWNKGTLCITIAANIAKTGILDFDACFPDSVVGFIPNIRTNNIYIHYWFTFFQEILENQAPESAQKNINLKILGELDVIVPPKEQKDIFASFVEQVDKLKFEVQKSLDESQMLFDSLMQEYFG